MLGARGWSLPAGEHGVVDEGDEAGGHDDAAKQTVSDGKGMYVDYVVKGNLLGNVSRGINDRLITDPDVTRRHPPTDFLIPPRLLQPPRLRHDVRNRTTTSIPDEMI